MWGLLVQAKRLNAPPWPDRGCPVRGLYRDFLLYHGSSVQRETQRLQGEREVFMEIENVGGLFGARVGVHTL